MAEARVSQDEFTCSVCLDLLKDPVTIHCGHSYWLHVVNITTDMDSPNRAMWKAFGVDHNKTSVPHPARPDRRLYFMPDVPHLVKNLKSALVRGQTFTIPADTVEKEKLEACANRNCDGNIFNPINTARHAGPGTHVCVDQQVYPRMS
ncbi:hypothetical protein DPX16_18171 [Anabarilius grahami]|uniref:Transposable element P transposase n=1 Tax=Anabarilius grahami TaxID=495550 RepID=A0A3N0YNY8_ANAGA|nr:hypothetical protein DPX16_18171 [Anabarilius grahami]